MYAGELWTFNTLQSAPNPTPKGHARQLGPLRASNAPCPARPVSWGGRQAYRQGPWAGVLDLTPILYRWVGLAR